jgi:Chromosome segregation protein Spc25
VGFSFSFTHLDAGDPERMFTFVLRANPNDVYEVDECSAAIDPKTLQTLLTNLNDTDDLASFMMGMRRAFSVTL